ncbi:MAG TPA: tRNA (guanosine(37)-N1)-methyltransferase TrmD [Saprospiraceae bacterium]|nr:tRNA (guanosine(37)-N1)-methyltransferase TrmD [Saprospiraceae bacterium]
MRFDIISAVPNLLLSPFEHSIIKRAQERELIEIQIIDLREFGIGKHKQIDDYQFGGGAGMVMMPEPLDNAISFLKNQRAYDEVIYMTPDGLTFDQAMANRLSLKGNIMIICGHYKGIDERIRLEHVTLEISIGDFVLSGGELAAALVVDAISRIIPGVLNNESSALLDSFQDNLLAPPVYTRPADYKGMLVPDVLLSGHEAKIDDWRYEMSIKRTQERRPDLLDK